MKFYKARIVREESHGALQNLYCVIKDVST
jgi:hypothetical protein